MMNAWTLMNILIVEPSNTYTKILSALLEWSEFSIEFKNSAAEALNYLTNSMPDAICVAHELGDSNSQLFMYDLNMLKSCNDIPKFLITSIISQEFKRQCYDIGYTDIFYKNDINTLQRALRGLVIHTSSNIKARVLYIEDVPSTAAYTIAIMNQVDWQVDHIHTGDEAIALLDKYAYDLVITDLILPGSLSGLALITVIRESENELIRNLPILSISGWNDLLRQVYVLQHGANDFVSKPFKENDFLARALNLVQVKRKLDKINEKNIELYNKAYTDKLTGLNNRHGFDKSSERIINKSIKNNDPVTILMIDIDYFKKINDSHGHAIGDIVLSQIGILIKGYTRQDDLAIRYGGEEFILLLPACNREIGLTKAENIRKDIEELKPAGIPITTSIGIVTMEPDNAKNIEWLMSEVDKAVYKAKSYGRNQVYILD